MKVLVRYGIDDDAGLDLLADSSILLADRPLFIADWAEQMQCSLGWVVRICRLGKYVAPRFAHRYWDSVTGCLVTRGLDAEGRIVGHDALHTSHDGALVLGHMVDKEDVDWAEAGLTADDGHSAWGTLPLAALPELADRTLCHISRHMTLKMGDLLCMCSDISRNMRRGDTARVTMRQKQLLRCNIK